MRRLPGAAPRYGDDIDAPRRNGIDLGLRNLHLARLLRHGLALDAEGWRLYAQRYGLAAPWPFADRESV